METAIAAPFLAVVIIGICDLARFGAEKIVLQQAVNRGLEMAMIGGVNTTTSAIQSQTATQANIPTGQVTVSQSMECDDVVTSWSSTCTSGQETERFFHVTATKNFTPSFAMGSLARMYGNANGVIPLSSTGVVRVQ